MKANIWSLMLVQVMMMSELNKINQVKIRFRFNVTKKKFKKKLLGFRVPPEDETSY